MFKLPLRSFIVLGYDVTMAAIAFCCAILLRYDFQLPPEASHLPWLALIYASITAAIFAAFRLHRSVWRYTASRDMWWLVQAISLTVILSAVIIFLYTRLEHFPRSAFVITWLLHMALSGAPRFAMRLWREQRGHSAFNKNTSLQNILIVGVNDAADLFIREVMRQSPREYNIHGILDDGGDTENRLVHGIPVMGSTVSLNKALTMLAKKRIKIDTLVLTNKTQTRLDELLNTAKEHKIAVRRLPPKSTLEEGEALTNLKPVLIEDLLMREPIKLDMSAIKKLVHNKRVLITGAGGSIGSELCRQIAGRDPKEMLLLDHTEFALYEIDMEMARTFKKVQRKALLVDVKEKRDVEQVLADNNVDIIFHAAAYKHVPLVEDNPISGIENNFFGTATVAAAAANANVPKMVVISTDKAVNPTNVMGTTKRAAEIFCQNQNSKTEFMTVRFGNVLGSTGSVVPLFTKQIREGGPITVTHKDATRYFMTIPEAVQLVLQAATLGKGGEVFMLDMGEPVKIWHLAEEMVRLSGLTPHEDIEIKEVGLRPGEKMYEELWYDGESMTKTDMKQIFLVQPVKLSKEELKKHMDAITAACTKQNNFDAVTALRNMVPEYTPAANSLYVTPKAKKA